MFGNGSIDEDNVAAAESSPQRDDSGMIEGESLEDQIAREVKEHFSYEAISGNSTFGTERIAYLMDKASWIARGAAFKATRELKASENYMVVTADEKALIESLRKPGILRLAPATELNIVDPLQAYLERQWDWSIKTFGPGMRTTGVLNHIRKELGEVEKEPFDLMEWIDIVILALDGYWRHGGSAMRLMAVLQHKQDKNFARNWPDWRQRSEDQAIEHDRSKDLS